MWIWNLEGGVRYPGHPFAETVSVNEALIGIEVAIGHVIDFPNPFPSEFGIETRRGIASHRGLQALYQAFRVRQMADEHGGKVVEIGAGLGRTAYYATRSE